MIALAGTGWLEVLEEAEGDNVTGVNCGDDTPSQLLPASIALVS